MRNSNEISDALRSLGPLSESNAQTFDRLVQEAALDSGTCTIQALLESFDDQCDYDELMFAVVHGLESRNRTDYLNCLLNALAQLHARAPKWIRILHTRIMNSAVDFGKYVRLFVNIDQSSKIALEAILKEISTKPNFRVRAQEGLDAIRAKSSE
jgi:hypothetical protein